MPRGRKPKHAIVMTKYIRGPKTVYWVEGMPSDFIEDDGRNIVKQSRAWGAAAEWGEESDTYSQEERDNKGRKRGALQRWDKRGIDH